MKLFLLAGFLAILPSFSHGKNYYLINEEKSSAKYVYSLFGLTNVVGKYIHLSIVATSIENSKKIWIFVWFFSGFFLNFNLDFFPIFSRFFVLKKKKKKRNPDFLCGKNGKPYPKNPP